MIGSYVKFKTFNKLRPQLRQTYVLHRPEGIDSVMHVIDQIYIDIWTSLAIEPDLFVWGVILDMDIINISTVY